ncbi:tetratricopeptide repeat protein [Pseudofulvibacter geojedonensis]|uniref:Tetratricopeptide repeat protein n=1 Tax=Pseudofulvibacter geojedonensis TaxID=1123758 RepID=A0ABW3I1U3_9FLAO
MKVLLTTILALNLSLSFAQKKKKNNNHNALKSHYEAYYKQMKSYGDLNGAIEGLNHLMIIEPTQSRKDTLAYLYLQANKALQAIKVVGESKSDLALRTKALAFKNLNNPKQAIENYETLISKNKSVLDAYELAQLQYGIQRYGEAKATINFGLQNAKDEKVKIFVKGASYLETSVKAAFLNVLGLIEYSMDKANVDKAIAIFDEALKIDPKFVLALENKKGLLAQKNGVPVEKKK